MDKRKKKRARRAFTPEFKAEAAPWRVLSVVRSLSRTVTSHPRSSHLLPNPLIVSTAHSAQHHHTLKIARISLVGHGIAPTRAQKPQFPRPMSDAPQKRRHRSGQRAPTKQYYPIHYSLPPALM